MCTDTNEKNGGRHFSDGLEGHDGELREPLGQKTVGNSHEHFQLVYYDFILTILQDLACPLHLRAVSTVVYSNQQYASFLYQVQ